MRQGRPDSEHVSLLTPQLRRRPHPRPRRCGWFLHQRATSSLAEGARMPTFSMETSGILRGGGDRKWRFFCFRLGHCFHFCWPLRCLALGGRRRGAPVSGPGTRREVLPGPGPLGWGCSAGTAAAHFPGWRWRPDPLLPRGRQHGPDDAQKAPDVEQSLCPSAPTSCAWHRARICGHSDEQGRRGQVSGAA